MSKLLLNTGLRMLYPFAPFLQDDWNITSNQMSTVLAIGELGGLVAGFFTPLADVTPLGRKDLALVAFVIGLLTMYSLLAPPFIPIVATLRFIYIVALNIYFVVLQSIIIALVPSSKKGRATGMLETSWSLSLLVIIPILSYAYTEVNWRAPFGILGRMEKHSH